MWGIIGLQDAYHANAVAAMERKIKDQITANEQIKCRNFEEIAKKFREYDKIIEVLLKRTEDLTYMLAAVLGPRPAPDGGRVTSVLPGQRRRNRAPSESSAAPPDASPSPEG
jgi:hypothetical protein